MLGFRITERNNDAVVEMLEEPISPISGPKVRAVHPATLHEVALWLKVLGLVARLDSLVAEVEHLRNSNDYLQRRIMEIGQEASDRLAEAKNVGERLDEAIEANNVLEQMNASLNTRVQELESK
jgi:hypothetical protein